ncbi:MAG: prepilin-type N-terminal cleavage/methylation domain-containing protein [Methylococcaceae bacterium]|nr:prepilin-type N-terminal cleavage/methylation domain-containing protein [Methylococcaceae bacterium]
MKSPFRSQAITLTHLKSIQQAGFTLLEVLIGMSLLGVMMVLLFGSLRVCVQNWDAGEAKLAQVSQSTIIQSFFINHLQNLQPLQDNFSEKKQFSFQGDANKLQFVSSMPASAGRLGLQLFTIGMDSKKSKTGDITVSMRPFFPVTNGSDWKIEEVVILKAVKNLTFEYFAADETKLAEPPQWQKTWLEKQQTPLLVKVMIEFMNGTRWSELIVALKVDSSSVMINPFGIVNGRFTN